MNYWLVKSEPGSYSWNDLVREQTTIWSGVRNFAARINLKLMKKGDLVLFYHSNEGKDIVGVAKVIKEAYQDPTTADERWVAVDIQALKPLKKTVTLDEIKVTPKLKDMKLLKIGRLSVSSVTQEEFETILKLGETSI